MNLAISRYHIVNGINVYIHFALLALPCLFCCLCFGFPMPQWEEAQKTQHTPECVWIPYRDDWKQEKSDESLKARQKQWILGTKFECSCEFHCMACARNFIDLLPLPLHGIRKRRNSAFILFIYFNFYFHYFKNKYSWNVCTWIHYNLLFSIKLNIQRTDFIWKETLSFLVDASENKMKYTR